jgi:signal transduction histidine kinase
MDSSFPASPPETSDRFEAFLGGFGVLAGIIELLPGECPRFGPANDCLRAAVGHRRPLAGMPLADVLPAAAAEEWEARCRRCGEDRTTVTWQAELEFPAGRRWWHTVFGPIPDRHGRVARILVIAFDITDRVVGERSLRSLAEDLGEAVEMIDQGLAIWDGDERLVHCNRRYRDHHPELSGLLAPGAAYRTLAWEAAARAADGSWLKTSEHSLAHGGLVSLTSDVTRVRAARRATDEARAALRGTLEAIADGIVVLTADGIVVTANGSGARLFELEPDRLAGCNLWSQIDATVVVAAAALVEEALSSGEAREHQLLWRGRRIALTARPVGAPGEAPVAAVLTARDRTEIDAALGKASEHQQLLARYLRIADIGEMAAGLAHEVNQPITAVLNYCRGLLRQLAEGGVDQGELTSALTEACREAERASAIVRNIHGFIARSPGNRAPTALNSIVEGVAARIRKELQRHKVELVLELMAELPAVAVNAVEIEQVVLNLVRNAIDAVSANPKNERRVTVRTSLTESGALTVSVADSGPGFSPEALAQAFTPFFTTKAGGIGMGLAICRTIVEGHGGRIQAEPGPAGGAVVRFTLPVEERHSVS